MSEEKRTVREKIIEATIECIEKEGMHAVTNRMIAKEAGVNSAAINYYFGSKENLLDVALNASLDNAFADPLFEQREIESYEGMRQVLREILLEHLQGMMDYPGLSKAHLYTSFIANDYSGNAAQRLNAFLTSLNENFQPFVPGLAEDLKLTLVQTYSAVFMMGLMPGIFKQFYDFDLNKREEQERFVEHLLSHYFPEQNR